jgi:hypothetical protein
LHLKPDATAAVLAENQFNDPPAVGNQFFIATEPLVIRVSVC